LCRCAVKRSVLFECTRIGTGQTTIDQITSQKKCSDRFGHTVYVRDEDAAVRWGDARA